MFIHQGSIYVPALSPADKRKKRELQLQEKFQEVLEEEGGDQHWTKEDLIEYVIEREQGLSEGSDTAGIVDPTNLRPDQAEKLYELMDEHFWEMYSESDVSEAAKEYVDPDLDEEELEEELEHGGAAWDQAYSDMQEVHWENHYDEVVAANFTTESKVAEFLSHRYDELEALSKGGDVWRGVVVEAKKDPTANYALGKWWTDKRELARPFLKEMKRTEGWHDPVVIRYHARVDGLRYVNLPETLSANAWALIHDGYETDKNEVQFFQYAPIYVYSAELLDTDPYSPDYGAKVVQTYPIEEMRRC